VTHAITIKLDEATYAAAKEKAERLGYFSVEEYVSEWIENDAAPIPMTPELAQALEVGLADSREGRVISIEEHDRLHCERTAAWIASHS
jgi:hypothetical protein